jgi:hypothetical protein
VNYTGDSLSPHPVLPFQVFGLYYDLDLVIVTRNTGWDMHEYARIQTPSGPIWMAKDSRPDGVQTIVSDAAALESLIAEVPVPRIPASVEVIDHTQGDEVDVTLSYSNPDGVATVVHFTGHIPEKPPRLRNGSTMGHSRQAVAAVLDLERFGTRNRAKVTMNGDTVPIKRMLGVLPMLYTLYQAQGGFAVSSWETAGDESSFVLTRPGSDMSWDPATGKEGWPTTRSEVWTVEGGRVVGDFGLNRYEYQFEDRELHSVRVEQFGRDIPVFELFLQPALPDLSRPFTGQAQSRFRMDINGQRGHGKGTIIATWNDDQVELQIIPEAPWWLADRPMHGVILFPADGRSESWIQRSQVPE